MRHEGLALPEWVGYIYPMARQLRIEYEGACYHVMCRGNGGNPIYKGDKDRDLFLKTLWECCKQTGWMVHAYVLMGNHYHLLIETPDANLVAGMKWFQGTYTQRFNARHRLWGHLYQGRYKSLVIDSEDPVYFQTVSTYIHLNPVRAKLIDLEQSTPMDYRWSSLSCYGLPPSKRPSALMLSRVLGSFGFKDTRAGRKKYSEWLEMRAVEELDPKLEKVLEAERKALKRGWYMGPPVFRDRLLDMLEEPSSDNCRGEQRLAHGEFMATELLNKGLDALRRSLAETRGLPQNHLEKQALAWLVKRHTTATGEWIRKELEMGSRANISRALQRFDHSAGSDVGKIKRKMTQCAG